MNAAPLPLPAAFAIFLPPSGSLPAARSTYRYAAAFSLYARLCCCAPRGDTLCLHTYLFGTFTYLPYIPTTFSFGMTAVHYIYGLNIRRYHTLLGLNPLFKDVLRGHMLPFWQLFFCLAFINLSTSLSVAWRCQHRGILCPIPLPFLGVKRLPVPPLYHAA